MPTFDMHSPKITGRLIAKNSLAFSFLTNIPIVPGHTLICPIRPVATCEELSHEEWKEILKLKEHVCYALKQAFHVEGFNFAWNLGESAGQTVQHFHLHVVPRKPGDTGILEYEPRVFLYRPGSRATSPSEELEQTAALIRKELENKG